MPIIKNSTYTKPPFYQFNAHLETILPNVFRKVKDVNYERERLELPDSDFLDLDWIKNDNENIVLLSHGLEGNSQRQYVKGMAKYFAQNNFDVLAWNCRSCSEEMNRTARLYHHGDIEDIGKVVTHISQQGIYKKLFLIGFSMGGAMSLNYLGRTGDEIPEIVKGAVAFSTPCDLQEGADILNISSNAFYRKRFLYSLSKKIKFKEENFPGRVNLENLKKVKVWRDFDEYFSAPLNGYKDADDFYYHSSAKNFMENIDVPILLVNALNDPILTDGCSPWHIAESNSNIFIENPERGGHVGFMLYNNEFAWSEIRALEWINEVGF